jgi:hypothetical protein
MMDGWLESLVTLQSPVQFAPGLDSTFLLWRNGWCQKCVCIISITLRWTFFDRESSPFYRFQLVVDGNMKCQQMKMKHPEDDFSLRDGEAFAVQSRPYAHHIKTSVKHKQASLQSHISCKGLPNTLVHKKSRCTNHKAVNFSNANWHNLECTGIAGCACARHGAFIPHMLVDFQKGERQVSACNQ